MSETFKGMNQQQIMWWNRMNDTMQSIHNFWCYNRTGAYELYTEKFRSDIEEACRRLGIFVAQAWDEDGWDGEQDANILTTSRQLEAIRIVKAGGEIPAWWMIEHPYNN